MKIDEAKLEWILIAAIGVILVFTFGNFGNEPTRTEVVIDESAFDDYPLIAWKDTHEKWDGSEQNIVKIKYRVFNVDMVLDITI